MFAGVSWFVNLNANRDWLGPCNVKNCDIQK